MAKIIKSVTFKSACIDTADMTITETGKDGIDEYSLQEILEQWNGIENITLTLRQEAHLAPVPNAE